MECVIFGNGEFSGFDIVSRFVDLDNTFTIAVDGGCNYLFEGNKRIDLVIGDFDSLKYKEVIYNNRHILKTDMDYNDLEIAMNYCLDNGFKKIYLFGFTGKRSDHFQFNIRTMQKFIESGLDVVMIDEFNIICGSIGCRIFDRGEYKFFSILPVYNGTVISICGSKYDLDNFSLNLMDTLTLSNEWVSEKVKISSNKLIFIYLIF
ncbi:thiamine diphosphokinase [Candidatus Arthromitus sp. SFB-rat-Yit]|uniref:thiamine diphosphokinase n=1 Tax=Candidatus Arthromitus sp. SFB-rat-Yit TaxID=1041504 RepID=UPI000227A654|nr:thiamine diphosphokinase [Candidatus Arthromitus sp. SFB-rat-Yit]BAK81067.1 thiamine pyrophosphokinase [Candidatus Arthromitus sp. SFB-rat-Yit]